MAEGMRPVFRRPYRLRVTGPKPSQHIGRAGDFALLPGSYPGVLP
jgi:hypothetical protein